MILWSDWSISLLLFCEWFTPPPHYRSCASAGWSKCMRSINCVFTIKAEHNRFPQISPYNYHIFTGTPIYSHKFPHDLSFIPTTLHQMTKIQWTMVQRAKSCTMRLGLDCATLKEDFLFNGRVLNIHNQNIIKYIIFLKRVTNWNEKGQVKTTTTGNITILPQYLKFGISSQYSLLAAIICSQTLPKATAFHHLLSSRTFREHDT